LAPLNPTRGECGCDNIIGLRDKKDISAEWSGDIELWCGKGWTRDGINILHFSFLFTCCP
jgi:hypothetical protein